MFTFIMRTQKSSSFLTFILLNSQNKSSLAFLTSILRIINLTIRDKFTRGNTLSVVNIVKSFTLLTLEWEMERILQTIRRRNENAISSFFLDIDLKSVSFLAFRASRTVAGFFVVHTV